MPLQRHCIHENAVIEDDQPWNALIEALQAECAHDQSLKIDAIALATFSGTGRGLMANKDIAAGEIILELPSRLIITPSSVDLRDCGYTATQSLVAQMIFLKTEGSKSKWISSYLQCIPDTFHLPVFESSREIKTQCPHWISQDFEVQKNRILNDLKVINSHRQTDVSMDVFKWAWSAVNTRCLYLGGTGDIGLLPVFDMFNHSHDVKTTYTWDYRVFRLYASRAYRRGQQVYINYGPHDNLFLLREYGFVSMSGRYDFVAVDEYLPLVLDVVQMKRITKNDGSMPGDLVVTAHDGPSWWLLLTLRLAFCTSRAEQDAWINVKDGLQSTVSVENELLVTESITRLLTIALNDLMKHRMWTNDALRTLLQDKLHKLCCS